MTGAILEEGLVGTESREEITCQKGEALFQKGVGRGGVRGEGTGVSRRGSCSSPSVIIVVLKKRLDVKVFLI
jgi:hypothetical protein